MIVEKTLVHTHTQNRRSFHSGHIAGPSSALFQSLQKEEKEANVCP